MRNNLHTDNGGESIAQSKAGEICSNNSQLVGNLLSLQSKNRDELCLHEITTYSSGKKMLGVMQVGSGYHVFTVDSERFRRYADQFYEMSYSRDDVHGISLKQGMKEINSIQVHTSFNEAHKEYEETKSRLK